MDSGADETGGYLMQLERTPPVPPLAILPYNLPVDDGIDPQTDRDCVDWLATAGTTVRFTLRSLTNGLDPEVQVFDPTGAVLVTPSCSGNNAFGAFQCTIQQDLMPAESGGFRFCVRDGGADEIGDYELALQCLFGACPNPNRQPLLDVIGDRSGDVGVPLEIVVSANDADGNARQLAVQNAPAGSAFARPAAPHAEAASMSWA